MNGVRRPSTCFLQIAMSLPQSHSDLFACKAADFCTLAHAWWSYNSHGHAGYESSLCKMTTHTSAIFTKSLSSYSSKDTSQFVLIADHFPVPWNCCLWQFCPVLYLCSESNWQTAPPSPEVSVFILLKTREEAQTGVGYTKPHVTKQIKINYSFCSSRSRILKQFIQNSLIS